VVDLDPQYAEAYALLGMTYARGALFYQEGDVRVREHTLELAQKAVGLDDSLPIAHLALGWAYFLNNSKDQALVEGKRAIVLAPNDADFHADLARMIFFMPAILGGPAREEEALRLLEKAERLDLRYQALYSLLRGTLYLYKEQNEEAIEALKKALS
jgi:tetratricopeptide (TPR) repeat protein